ncbi:MAG: hypothetical protein MUF13_00895 [Akkermansiaceae bacterium]|jgi:hypothetical protein|nr:hypothetical protein [Akkermansiaceae bacterium]
MEGFDLSFGRGLKPSFDAAPPQYRRCIDGVDYLHLKGRQSGDLYITRDGWPVASSILPERWFTGDQFSKPGQALAGATGAVYRVPVAHPVRSNFALVVKFSRFGQDVGLTVVGRDLHGDADFMARVEHAEFLPPFAEFGNLMRLRRQCRGHFFTKAPLAIYSPPTRYLAWQLGRKNHLQSTYSRRLLASQTPHDEQGPIEYEWERIYILLYRWMGGVDAEQAYHGGIISNTQMTSWTHHIADTLRQLGWVVLDHKPRHLIVRPRKGIRQPLMRKGSPVIGLVDYELLYPTC